MKRYVWLVTVVMAFAVTMLGCSSKKNEVDTAKLQKAFQSADTKINSSVNNAIVAIQSEDWPGALAELKKVAAETKLTPEQQSAVKSTIEQVTQKMGDAAKKAVGDIQKSMPK